MGLYSAKRPKLKHDRAQSMIKPTHTETAIWHSPFCLLRVVTHTETERDTESCNFGLWQWRRLHFLLLVLHPRYLQQLDYCRRRLHLHLSYFVAIVSAKHTIPPNSNLLETSRSEPPETLVLSLSFTQINFKLFLIIV